MISGTIFKRSGTRNEINLFLEGLSGGVLRVFFVYALFLGAGCSLPPSYERVSVEQILLAPQWQVEVLSQGHARIDNIVVLPDETVYATLERGRNQGQLIAIKGASTFVLLTGLNRPDGLVYADHVLYLTEEVLQGRVIAYRLQDGGSQVLARLASPEGIAVAEGKRLIVAEDRHNGRILQLTPAGISILAQGLQRPEGVCLQVETGSVFVAETATGRILMIKNGKTETVAEGLHEPDQVKCAADGSIWITEDQKSGRLLRYFQGRLHVIADALNEPQGISLGNNGQVYVAEQGRGRVLRFKKR